MEIHSIHQAYYLLTLLSAGIILTLSYLLMAIRLPKTLPYLKLRKARIYFSLSYFILGSVGFCTAFFPESATAPLPLLLITSIVAAFQALLFTSTFVVFVQPGALRRRWLLIQVAAIGAGAGLVLGLYTFPSVSETLVYAAVFTLYFVQQVYYTVFFLQQHRSCVRQMEQYYDEEQQARLRWLKYSFFSALTIGLLSVFSSCSGLTVYLVFTLLYTGFYTYMFVLFYNHHLITKVVYPAVASVTARPVSEPVETALPSVQTEAEVSKDEQFKHRLEEWIARKGFLQKDLSVDDIAALLQIDRNYLRYYFRTYIHKEFRTWRADLRVAEAKRILCEHPDYSLTQVAEMVGFNHRSNLFHQFSKSTGMTLTAWRDQQQTVVFDSSLDTAEP